MRQRQSKEKYMVPSELVTRIFDHVENGDVDKAVRASLRLSRHLNDHMSTALFLRDLVEDRVEVSRVLYEDVSHLKEEAFSYLMSQSAERWLDSRTLPFGPNGATAVGDDTKRVLIVSVGDFPAELDQCEKSINDLALPASMGEYDSAAFTDRYQSIKSEFRLRIKSINIIKTRVLNKCLNFAIQMERQLAIQSTTKSYLEKMQNDVLNYFRSKSEDVYQKIHKANQLISSDSSEDLSLLLTQVRRALKSVADYFYPASESVVRCNDGIERKMGDEQYLNRLHEFVHVQFKRSTSTDLLRAELDHLLTFAKKLNDIASKGVHADVTLAEAQQGYLGLYMFLFNVIQRLDTKALERA